MKKRPIIFSGEMVRAILDGRKTQTRRPITNIYALACELNHTPHSDKGSKCSLLSLCPFGQVGDRLWVRETWTMDSNCRHHFRATEPDYKPDTGAWNPPLYMSRWQSRITLEITEVKVERLQKISEGDAIQEGWPKAAGNFDIGPGNGGPFDWFKSIWNPVYSKKGFGWDANPWVWAITFKKVG